jgi:hypothetical protein
VLGTGHATALIDDAALSAAGAAPLSTGATSLMTEMGLSNVGLSDVVLARFSDADGQATASDFAVNIDWGDSTQSAGKVTAAEGELIVTGSHAYQVAGSFLVAVQIRDTGPQGAVMPGGRWQNVVVTTPVRVQWYTEGIPGYVSAGVAFDCNSLAWVPGGTIDWGDGTSSSLLYYSMLHAFAHPGSYTVSASYDSSGDSVHTSEVATVADAGLSVIGAVPQLNALPGEDVTATLASVSDDNPAQGRLSAQADWGDGTSGSVTVVDNPDGTFLVQGDHTWAEAGKYNVFLTITDDDGGSSTTACVQVDVTDTINPFTATPFAAVATLSTGEQTLATFTQSGGTAEQDKVEINWGDGTTSAGTVVATETPDVYEVQGEHTYTGGGTDAVRVTLTDPGGGVHQADTSATVFTWTTQDQQLSSDPQQGMFTPLGEANVSLNTGEVQLTGARRWCTTRWRPGARRWCNCN